MALLVAVFLIQNGSASCSLNCVCGRVVYRFEFLLS